MEQAIQSIRQALLAFAPTCPQEENDRREMLHLLDTQPHLLTRQNTTAHFTASALVVDSTGQRTLLAWHNIYRSWSWLGGHADGESNLAAVALREVQEESGLTAVQLLSPTPLSLEILPVWGHVKRGEWVSAHLHLNLTYLIQGEESHPLTGKADENSGVAWFPLAELPTRTAEREMVPIYQKLLRRFADRSPTSF